MEAECTSVDRPLRFLVGGPRQSLHLSVGPFAGCWGQIIRLSVRQLIGGIRLFVCLPACLSVYMSVRHLNGVIRLSICLFIWLAETDCLSVGHLVGGLAGSVHQMFGGFSRSVYLFKYRSKIDLFAYSVDLTLSILTVSILLSCNRLTIFSFF